MSINDRSPSLDAELEKHIDGSLLQNINSSTSQSPTLSRAQPGAILLSPSARAQATPSELLSPEPLSHIGSSGIVSPVANSSMALLSPPGSRYAFENENNNPISPLLSSTNNPLVGAFNNTAIQRPLSAQSFNIGSNNNNQDFDAFRPFSAQGISSNNAPFNIPERPLSSMEIDSLTFKNDVANLINWINTLNLNQHKAVVDNLIANLSDEVLNYARAKLSPNDYGYQNNQIGSKIASPVPFYQPSVQEPITLDSVLNGSHYESSNPNEPTAINLQRALSPNFSTYDRNSLLQDVGFNRPRSADPYSKFNKMNNFDNQDVGYTPSKSRSRFEDENQYNINNNNNNSFDITNLAQQMTQTPIKLDYNNSNVLKLSALSTINSRVQLDSGKRRVQSPSNDEFRGRSQAGYHTIQGQHVYNLNEEVNIRNSSSVPPPQRVNYYEQLGSPSVNRVMNKQRNLNRNQGQNNQNNNGNSYNDQEALSRLASLNSAVKNLGINDHHDYNSTPYKNNSHLNTVHNNTPKSPAINPKQLSNPKLLNDIPAWLKTLRLHKYTSALQDIPWRELIYLDDKQLEEKGVSAMGARGKLLKAFEVVKQNYEGGLVKE